MLFLENYVNVDTGLPIPSPISGADQKTRITPLKVAKLVNNNGDSNIPAEYQQSDTTLANKKGGYNLKVDAGLGTTDLSVGDLVMIMDDRIEDEVAGVNRDFSSYIQREIRRVVGIGTTTNIVSLNQALTREYKLDKNARIAVMNAPYDCSIRMSKVQFSGAQETKNFHPAQIDYGENSVIEINEMDGWQYRQSQAARISNSYNCRIQNSSVYGTVEDTSSGRSYGWVMYYSSNCKIIDSVASDGRHNYLVQGSDNCDIINCTSINDRISGIDVHGVGGTKIRIMGCRVLGGDLKYGNNRSGIRVGNSSHVVADTDVLVKDNSISGFTKSGDSAIDIVGPSSNTIIQGNSIYDCYNGITNTGNNTDRGATTGIGGTITAYEMTTQTIDRVIVRDNTFTNITNKLCQFETGDLASEIVTPAPRSKSVNTIELHGNTAINCFGAFDFDAITKLNATNNTVVAPANTTHNMFTIEKCNNVFLSRNTSRDLSTCIVLDDCLNPKVIGNDFGNTIVGTSGTTSGLVAFDNADAEPIEYISGITTSTVFTGAYIDISTSTIPTITDGAQVQSTTFTAAPNQIVEIEGVVPYVESSSAGSITLTLFYNNTLVGVGAIRATSGTKNGQSVNVSARVVGVSSGTNSVEMRIGHRDTGNDLTINSRYTDGTDSEAHPYITIRRF